MDLILSFVGVFALGGWIGYKINDFIIRQTFEEMIRQAGLKDKDIEKFINHWAPIMEEDEATSTESGGETLEITLEKQGDMLYAYRKDNSRFLAQGRNQEELVEALSKDWPGVTLLLRKEDGGNHLIS